MTNQPYFKFRFLAYISIFFPLIYFIYSILRIKWWQDNYKTLQAIYGEKLIWRSDTLLALNNIIPIWSNASLPVMFTDMYEITKKFNPNLKIPKSITVYRRLSYLDIFLSYIRFLTMWIFVILIMGIRTSTIDPSSNDKILITTAFIFFVINFGLYFVAYLQMRTEVELYDNLSEAIMENQNDYKKFLENH